VIGKRAALPPLVPAHDEAARPGDETGKLHPGLPQALANAATMEEVRRVKGLGLTARIRFTEEERKGGITRSYRRRAGPRARQPSTARPTRFSSLIFPRPKSWPFGLSIVTERMEQCPSLWAGRNLNNRSKQP